MTRIIVERSRGYYAAARAVRLFADGVKIGEIRQGDTIELELPEGAQTLVGTVDWGKTNTVNVQAVGDGARFTLKPWFSLNPLRGFGIIELPIKLEMTLESQF